jgi:uncharacterized protein YqgV (UPF0045/DUF77 family)
MNITVDISMYPLNADFRDRVLGFIEKLESRQNLRVNPGSTSTVIIGEYRTVMEAITEMLEWSHKEHGQSVFITKFILDYEAE